MNSFTRKTALASAVALAFGLSGLALADSHTDSFVVSATVVASCHVDGTQNIDFPAFDAFTGDSGTGDLTIRCTNDSGYSIQLAYTGQMAAGAESLGYSLFQDAGHETAWDADLNAKSATGNGDGQIHTVYADVPADSTAKAGAYSETVNVTVVLD